MNTGPQTLDQLCEFVVDCLHATAPIQDDGFPLIRTPNIGRGRLKLEGAHRVSEEVYEEWTRRAQPQTNDLIMAREAPAGNVAIIRKRQVVCLGQRTVHLRPDSSKVHAGYLCFLLLTPLHQAMLLAKETGATAKHINLKDIRNHPIPTLPPLEEQERIADTLSAYDDLIENNRRRIELLEQAARLIYKEWFVHLRFPGHENVPVVDGVPEGWTKSTIGDSASFISRGITPKYDSEADGVVINQKCIRDRQIDLSLARNQSKKVPAAKLVRFGDVLINSTGQGTLGRVAQFLDQVSDLTADSHVTIARPEAGCPLHLFGQSIESQEKHLAASGRGATNQTELSKETVEILPFLWPSSSVSQAFESLAQSSGAQIQNLARQNTKLAEARDLLLPRLMSGQIKV